MSPPLPDSPLPCDLADPPVPADLSFGKHASRQLTPPGLAELRVSA